MQNLTVQSGVSNFTDVPSFLTGPQLDTVNCYPVTGVIFTFIYSEIDPESFIINGFSVLAQRSNAEVGSDFEIDFGIEFEPLLSQPNQLWKNPFSCAENEVCWTLYPPNTQQTTVAPLFTVAFLYIIIFLWYYSVRDTNGHQKIKIE